MVAILAQPWLQEAVAALIAGLMVETGIALRASISVVGPEANGSSAYVVLLLTGFELVVSLTSELWVG